MPRFNTLWAVVEEIDAPDGEAALNELRSRLDQAGFTAYDGTPDLVPEGYQLVYLSENQEPRAPSIGDISYDEDSDWCQEHGHTGLLPGCRMCDKLIAAKPRFARYAAVREQDWRMFPHDEECPRCGRRQWTDENEQETCQACGYRYE